MRLAGGKGGLLLEALDHKRVNTIEKVMIMLQGPCYTQAARYMYNS